MKREEVVQAIQEYIAKEILSGNDIGLNETTPLLEWGIINSFELVRLQSFVQERFDVAIPMERVTAANFGQIRSIGALVAELKGVEPA
jgi:acyl carrier protein